MKMLLTAIALVLVPCGTVTARPDEASNDAARESLRRADRLRSDGAALRAAAAYREALLLLADLPAETAAERHAESELALLRLNALRQRYGTARTDRAALEKWAARADSPFVSAIARRDLGFALMALGEPQKAREVWAPLLYLDAWHIVGPFDNERGGGFQTAFGPEKEVDLSETFDGKTREVAWRPLPGAPLAGDVDLGALLDPREEALAYAVTFVEADRGRPAALSFGTKNGFKIWVNGAEVSSRDVQRPYRRKQDRVGIQLQKGWNTILFKLPQSKGAWRFSARLTRPDGGPLSGVREGRPPKNATLPRLEEAPPAPALAPTPVERLAGRLGESPTDARSCYVVGALLGARHHHDENEHPDTAWLDRAVGLDASDPVYYLELAKSEQRSTTIAAQQDDNAWRRAMEKAFELGSADAAYRLALHYSGQFDSHGRALDLIEIALERNPAFEAALRLRGTIEEDLGFPRARERADAKIAELPHPTTSSRVRAARAAARRGRPEEAIEALRAVLREDAFQSTARRRLIDVYRAVGRDDDAARLLRAGARLSPYSTPWRLSLASHLEGRDRFDEALAAVNEALSIRPDDAQLFEKRATYQRRLGDRAAALASLDEALRLRPNSPQIREYVEFLRTPDDALENIFRRNVAGLIEIALEDPGENPDDDPARILLELSAVNVNQDGTTKEFFQRVVQILNDRGVQLYDRVPVYYARGEQRVEFKKARVHHPDGTYRDADLDRFGGRGGGGGSARVDLPPLSKGDVIELEFVREDLQQSFFGDYYGHRELFQRGIPVEEKTFILRVPEERKFSFHQRGFDVEPEREAQPETSTVTYTWTAENIPKIEPEPNMPPSTEVSPVLEISTFESWTAFCNWYWNLIRNQFESSPEIRRKVRELTSGLEDDAEKIRVIYEFIVSDVRYNAWEFGVHGFKPYNASTIFARRFGDCKDKATLMTVMLNEVGITSHPVLIYATQTRAEEDLSLPLINHFNHCITYVPAGEGREALFLDGTASHHRVEELPSMDRGRESWWSPPMAASSRPFPGMTRATWASTRRRWWRSRGISVPTCRRGSRSAATTPSTRGTASRSPLSARPSSRRSSAAASLRARSSDRSSPISGISGSRCPSVSRWRSRATSRRHRRVWRCTPRRTSSAPALS